MGNIDELTAQGDGVYRYVLIRRGGQFRLGVGNEREYATNIAIRLLNDEIVAPTPIDLPNLFETLGGVGSGFVEYRSGKAIYHLGCDLGPSPQETDKVERLRLGLVSVMAGTGVPYEAPLSGRSAPIIPRRP